LHAPDLYTTDVQNGTANTKKTVTLYFWQHEKWHSESVELVWSDNKAETIEHLVTNWLALLEENNITHKKITLQSALLSPSTLDAYLSFDRSPFAPQATTHEKLMLIEGLLKTLRSNNIKLQGVRFLVNHNPLNDNHLDFSKEWPIIGFLE